MDEEKLQKISDYIENNSTNKWMSDLFKKLNVDLQFQIIDAIIDLAENQEVPIEKATLDVFMNIAQQMGILEVRP